MKIEIDQSGKIEQTSLDTIVALSNDIQLAVRLTKKSKRDLLTYFRIIKKKNIFSYITFAALVAILLKYYHYTFKVTIDVEYEGHEPLIKEYVIIFLKHFGKKHLPPIVFDKVGKSSSAHQYARKIVKGKLKATKLISFEEIVELTKLL